MNEFIVTAPEAGFSGESAGVVFKDGVGRVTDASKEGRAAIEYFRRRGYALTLKGSDEESKDAEQEAPGEKDDDEPFDPSKHDAPDVVAYLDSLGTDDSDSVAEFERVLEAERNGKARKTILQKGAEA
ncbi:MAG: hypothetical protein HOV66_11805 [Streptomycetaceae bacterium]|nr:hypothetical protein [Streptomycetaceae bacterium]